MHQLQRQYVNLNNLFIDLKAKGRMATNMLENQKDIHNDVQYQKKNSRECNEKRNKLTAAQQVAAARI